MNAYFQKNGKSTILPSAPCAPRSWLCHGKATQTNYWVSILEINEQQGAQGARGKPSEQ
jgi:hypothetical protein